MRIIGYIPHPTIKITVFKTDNKLLLKLETALYEQTYKFRMNHQMDGFQAIEKLMDEPFLKQTLDIFNQMNACKQSSVERNFKEKEEEWEEII